MNSNFQATFGKNQPYDPQFDDVSDSSSSELNHNSGSNSQSSADFNTYKDDEFVCFGEKDDFNQEIKVEIAGQDEIIYNRSEEIDTAKEIRQLLMSCIESN